MEKLTVSVQELSMMLGCSIRHTYKMLYEHELPFAKQLGSKWIISKDAVIRWLNEPQTEIHIRDTEYNQLFQGRKEKR